MPSINRNNPIPSNLKTKEIDIKRTSITLADGVYENGLVIASQRGFGQSFSAYIAWLIQRDAEGGVTREEAPRRTAPIAAEPVKRRKGSTKAGSNGAPGATATPARKGPKPKAEQAAQAPKAPQARATTVKAKGKARAKR